MKTVVLLSVGLLGLVHSPALAAAPAGTVLELHSCELYAGGCVVSSEATQGGRYLLRVWNFTGGESAGTSLAGLQVALLQVSDDNLAAPDSLSSRGVLYLLENATAEQRLALRKYVDSTGKLAQKARPETRVVPMKLTRTADGYQFSAGDYISVKTAPLSSCPTGGCGEALWYTPRTEGAFFTVAVNQSSRVAEPRLQLKWEDSGKKSVFLTKFGADTPTKNLFVSSAEFCAPDVPVF